MSDNDTVSDVFGPVKRPWQWAGPECERGELMPCDCPYSGPVCGSRGKLDCPIVFVGEAPGRDERVPGIPLIGDSGELFYGNLPPDSVLQQLGVPVEDILVLNACQCVPPRMRNDAAKNTRIVMRGAQCCRPRLLEQIQRHPRKLIVAMGNQAVWSLTGQTSSKITQIRGAPIPSPLAELGILPVVHPAALMHGTGNFRQYKMDIAYGFDLLSGLPQKQPITPYFLVCDTPDKVKRAIRRLIKKPVLDCDIETTGFNVFRDDILALGICHDPRLVYIFPGAIRSIDRMIELRADDSWLDGQPSMLPLLKPLFKRYRGTLKFSHNGTPLGRGKLCWHNGKFDVGFLRQFGFTPDEVAVDEDTMVMSYALDEQRGIHDLEQVAGDLLGAPDYKYMVKLWVPRQTDSYARIPRHVLYNYLAFDVSNTNQIRGHLRRRVAEDAKLEKLYTELLIPTIETLLWIHLRGMPVSRLAIERQQIRLQRLIDKAEEIVQVEAHRAGIEGYVNTGSPQQMNHIIFDVLGFPVPKGMERSTRKEVLEKLPQTPFITSLRSYRNARKFKSTYADALIEHIEPTTGRVHPDLLLHGTRTGRLSHKIVANIPRDRRIRSQYAFDLPLGMDPAFSRASIELDKDEEEVYSKVRIADHLARSGRLFLKADLDQAELRFLAAMSGDPELCGIYRSTNRKLHREVSDDIWGKGGWGEEEYMRAKALNFGIVYGRQAASIALEFNIGEQEAQGMINYWAHKFPVAWGFIDWCRKTPQRMITMVTPFGRKKRHWVVTNQNLIGLQNEASNFPHQSGASDIVLEASNKLTPQLHSLDCWIILLVHDEILIDIPNDLSTIQKVRPLVEAELAQAPLTWGITRVPFVAETSIGRRWGIYMKDDKRGDWARYLQSKIHLAIDNTTTDQVA